MGVRILWRFGTIGLAMFVAAVAGGGNAERGIGAAFVVVFASLFLNWSVFARSSEGRWVGLVALAAVGAVSGWAYSSSAGLVVPVRLLVALLGAAVLGGARLAIDGVLPIEYRLNPPPLLPHPAVWAADPYGRHQLRYWNGTVWTAQVSDTGVRKVDQPGWHGAVRRPNGNPRLPNSIQNVPGRFCPSCSEQLDQSVLLCPHCGRYLK